MQDSFRRLGRLLAAVLLVGAAGAGGLLMWSWAPDVPVERLKARWAGPPSLFMALDGMDVHYRDEGPRDDPAPLVLLHGTSSSLHTFDGWAERLSKDHRVIRMDLPGFGLTGPRPDADYTTGAYLTFLTQFLDRLGVPRFVLGGNSLGGGLAWAGALGAPERVVALILIDAVGYPTRPTSVPIGFRIAQMEPLNRLFEYALPRSLIVSSLQNVYGDPRKVTPDTVDLYFDMAVRSGNRRAMMTRMGRTGEGPAAARIADIRQPTLVLWGGQDRLVPPENAARFHDDIRGSTLRIFPDLGHVPEEEDSGATAEVVAAFLRTLDKSRREQSK